MKLCKTCSKRQTLSSILTFGGSDKGEGVGGGGESGIRLNLRTYTPAEYYMVFDKQITQPDLGY